MAAPASPSRSILRVAFTFELALGVLGIGVGWLIGCPPLGQLEWTARAFGQGLLATVPLVAALLVMTRYPIGPLKSLEDLVRGLVATLFGSAATWELLVVSLAAGWGEELLFRGALQRGIEHYSGHPWLALVATSVLFGLAHAITRVYAALASVIGIYLGWLLLATDNLLVPITAHALYDFVALAYFIRTSDAAPRAEFNVAEQNGARAEDL